MTLFRTIRPELRLSLYPAIYRRYPLTPCYAFTPDAVAFRGLGGHRTSRNPWDKEAVGYR
jgi:hypothetical protein